MVIVDSCIWIESYRAKGQIEVKHAIKALLEEYEAAFCGPILLEVLGGTKKTHRPRLKKLFNSLPYRRHSESLWNDSIKNAWKVRDQGINPKWNDILIATYALRNGDRIYSIDKHFQEMAPILGFQLYEPGYGGSYNPD